MAEIGYIKKREITQEMKESYLDYAMSVIVSRALPDVRDGLKPVQRRILYAMDQAGLRHNAKHVKSARVVGNVMSFYHPHGDASIYEAMVRMAQDFSLRYPLVDGQGNFGCFTKDTKVKLTDGRNLTFGELIEEHRQGKKNFTYTINSLGLVSIVEIKNPRLTRVKAELIKVTLDNGEEIKCTPNHLFMLKEGHYKEAKDLIPDESLMPLYQRRSEKTDRLNREGYILIYQPKIDKWTPAHHLADNYNLTHKKYYKNTGRVRHHIDFNKLNNNPDNIIRMHWGEHWKIHYTHAANQHKNPEYRKKIADGRNKYWANPGTKAKYAVLLSERNKKNWQSEQYRGKMRNFLSEVNKKYVAEHPEKRIEFSRRLTQTLKRQWQNPIYRAFMHEKIIKGNKNHTTNKTGKLKFINICREVVKKYRVLNPSNYEKIRNKFYPYGAATLWETGLSKYFQNNPSLIYQEINKNHKIIRVEKINERENVYDLTIEGTHNFALAAGIFVHNSIDGDSAAAMRYSEARMSSLAEELLSDIEKDTVDFIDNYDATRKEPVVLPSRLPNLLLNGTVGIAVGMATNIPPHNIREVLDGLIHLIDNPEAGVQELAGFVQGPDFPTGGIIYNKENIINAYASGRGPVVTRAKTEIEEDKKGSFRIVVTEIPYQVNKAELIIKIADLVKDKKIEGIRDLRDESDREGLRIVIELKQDSFPRKVLNQLFKYTDLQKTFHFNMVALLDGIQPQTLSLKTILEKFIEHRKKVITRRTKFDLAQALARAHILEGLKKALDHIDEVIATIKKSETREDAFNNLIKKFKFTELQTNAILEMRLQTLAGLERKKIDHELKEKKELIAYLEDLLASPKKILKKMEEEFTELKQKYGDERKTKIVKGALKEIGEEELVPEEDALFVLTHGGYIKRMSPTELRIQKRGGKGLIGMATKEEDVVSHFFLANTRDNLFFFTASGKVFQTKGYEVPEASRVSRGKAIVNFLNISSEEVITAVVPAPREKTKEAKYLFMATKDGVVKKVEVEDFANIRKSGLIAIKLHDGDSLNWVRLTSGSDEVLLVTSDGSSIRFKEKDVRPMGRNASGVNGIKLNKPRSRISESGSAAKNSRRESEISLRGKNDQVVGMEVIQQNQISNIKNQNFQLLVIMENGYGKRTDLKAFKTQRRAGKGIKAAKVTSKTGKIVSAQIVNPEKIELIVISKKGQIIRTDLKSVSVLGRATQGVRVMRMDLDDGVASVVVV